MTRWDVRWTSGCDVSVNVVYTIPRHVNPAAMSADLRARFDLMIASLMAHERQHGQHGIAAAKEIRRAGCSGAQKIIRKYVAADRELDRRTRHGRNTGVRLN